jgi:pyruvate formate lyase activating enzyme
MSMGRITQIQSMSIHDGPGIRTTVFTKGCNMRCTWCHNPETGSVNPQIQFLEDKCIDCKACLQSSLQADFTPSLLVKPNHFSITESIIITESCYTGALEVVGKDVSVDDVMKAVEKDREFFDESGGGITISGGEPLLQSEFVIEIFKRSKQIGIHTAIETNLHSNSELVKRVAEYTDLFMVDIKLWDSGLHKKWTGLGNELVLENIKVLNDLGKSLIIRTPVIPGVNDNIEELSAIAEFVNEIDCLVNYELLPYHSLGNGKYIALGMEDQMPKFDQLSKDHFEQLQKEVAELCKNFKKN